MFKKGTTEGKRTLIQSSESKKLIRKFLDTWEKIRPYEAELFPKKTQLTKIPISEFHSNLYSIRRKRQNASTGKDEEVTELLFYEYDAGPGSETILIPHLKLVHQYPWAFGPRIRIDRGAIRFVLSGATLMVPGLTSPGGRLPGEEKGKDDVGYEESGPGPRYGQEDIEKGTVVVVEAEGKEEACLIGPLKMGTKEMKEKKKGVAMDMGHYVGDWLWSIKAE